MGEAKRLVVKPISPQDANRIIRALHYSGKVVNNSQIHLGVFMDGKCGGAMQFGPSLDKRKMQGLVRGTLWNEFIELNRMAFADWLPRNGESRCIGFAMRWLRKTYPWLKWVVSFADGTQCGDGTIYRASGFMLTGIKKNNQIWVKPGGGTTTRMVATDTRRPERGRLLNEIIFAGSLQRRDILNRVTQTKGVAINETGGASMRPFIEAGYTPLAGFQIRYIYFLDPTAKDRLTVPILPFSEIERRGAGMYKGQPKRAGSIVADAPSYQHGEDGSTPIPALQAN